MCFVVLVFSIISFLFSHNSFGQQINYENQILELSRSNEWHRLLHYKPRTFGGYKSEVDDPAFFFAKTGKTDPLQELVVTISAFSNPLKKTGRFPQISQCAFPARYKLIKNKLQLNIKDIYCKEFIEWKNGLAAKGVSISFSSSYPNNPASAFGHTFLRFKKSGSVKSVDPEKPALLDYGVNYAADAEPTFLGIKYITWGLFGGYAGYYAITPYYKKVNEYVNSDSRDIWEYDLNLTQERIDKIIYHLWELYSNSFFWYFFLDENCSYHLLSLLDVANPEWNLTDKFGNYVLPSDTIKTVMNIPDLVSNIKFRPSNYKKIRSYISVLHDSEKEYFNAIVSEVVKPDTINSAPVLDAVISFLDYKKYENEGILSDQEKTIFRNTLIARSKIKNQEKRLPPPIDKKNRPDISQNSSAIGGSFFNLDGNHNIGLKIKWGLHDLLNTNQGYEPFTDINFLDLNFLYLPSKKTIKLGQIVIFETTSLFPYDPIHNKISWRISITGNNFMDFTCNYCYGSLNEGGLGLTLSLFNHKSYLYSFILGYLDYSKHLPTSFRFGPRLLVGSASQIGEKIKLLLEGRASFDTRNSFNRRFFYTFNGGTSYSFGQNLDLRFLYLFSPRHTLKQNDFIEWKIELNYYYL